MQVYTFTFNKFKAICVVAKDLMEAIKALPKEQQNDIRLCNTNEAIIA